MAPIRLMGHNYALFGLMGGFAVVTAPELLAAMLFTPLMAAANPPSVHMGYIDGHGYDWTA